MKNSLFEGRKLLIASKHKKEKVIAPLLEKHLGVTCFTNENFDTDTLGTFSGEIKRELDPITTLRKKCLLAMEASHCSLAVASEGSFGSHPYMFFAKADEEFLIFIDKINNIEIIAKELSIETNFDGKEIKTEKELLEFAEAVKFPSHGLIARKSEKDNAHIIKGISDINSLKQAFRKLIQKSDSIYVETDMRAMLNPSRMKVIEIAAEKLVEKIKSCCPECNMPGFDISDINDGLKCKLCGLPTKSTLSYTYTCQHCKYNKEKMFPHNKTKEDPMYCNYCNP